MAAETMAFGVAEQFLTQPEPEATAKGGAQEKTKTHYPHPEDIFINLAKKEKQANVRKNKEKAINDAIAKSGKVG